MEWASKNRKRHSENTRNWWKNNKEKHAASTLAWRKNNPLKITASKAFRRSAIGKRAPSWRNEFFIEEIYDLAARRTALKSGGHDKWEVDHIVPLRSPLVCGLHVENNLQVIPANHNRMKGNRIWPDMP